MKKLFKCLLILMSISVIGQSKIEYTEYDLDNGMHVILHEDKSAPVVTAAVSYVGAKDENRERTDCSFFRALTFEGTENIPRGEWFTIVSNGGSNNANTTETELIITRFSIKLLGVGLWMESERLLHPVINQIGVDTQNEVVKEEKKSRQSPYGKFIENINSF